MERLELCARLARLLRPATAEGAATTELRDALRDVDALYAQSAPASLLSPVTATAVVTDVDDMIVVLLLRLLATAIAPSDLGTAELSFKALAAVLPHCRARLPPTRRVDLLQACAAALPVPPSAAAVPSAAALPISLRQQPEELRTAVLSVLEMTLSTGGNSGASALDALLLPAPAPTERVHFVAYLVSCLLHIAESDRCRSAAQLALAALTCIVDGCDSVVLRQFYPGISIGLWRCVTAPLQSSAVMTDAIQCLARTIARCMSDDATGVAAPREFSLESLRAVAAQPVATVETADAWVAESATKTDELLSRLLTAKLSQSPWRVQRAVVDLCAVVVLQCRHSLRDALLRCVDELLVLRGHAIEDVATAAQSVLADLRQLSLDEWLELEPRVAERFGWHLSTLALQCRTEQESESVHTMEILIGYLQCLGHQQAMLSVLDDSLSSVVSTLARVVEFDTLDVALVWHETLVDATDDAKRLVVPHFQKRLRHFHDDLSVRTVFRLLRALGAVVPMALLIDTVLTMLREEPEAPTAAAIIVILNEALRVHVDADDASRWQLHLVGRILDDLLELPQWTSTSGTSQTSSVAALLVETVGVCTQLTGDAFSQFLLYVLYPLVEKLGHADVQVERAALTTLHKIAFLTGHGSHVDALFERNMDYLVDALCRRLERLDESPHAPRVVEALLRHTRLTSAKPLVDEITRALLRCIDLHQDSDEMSVLLRSLRLLLERFDSNSGSSSNGSDDSPAKTPEQVVPSATTTLDKFLAELRAWTEPISSGVEDATDVPEPDDEASKSVEEAVKGALPVEYEESANDDDADNEDEDSKNRLPFEPQVLEIMARCSYFVVDSDPIAACVVLETMERGFLYLKHRERVLLPLIHRTWPSLLDRLTLTSNRPLLTATIDVLTLLADIAGDFIGDRFVETVWPTLRRVLEGVDSLTAAQEPTLTRAMLQLNVQDSETPPQSTENESSLSVGGRKTHEMRLVEAALRCASAVGRRSTVTASLVPEMTPLAIRLLHPSLPTSVVSAAIDLLEVLSELNGDEVFVALAVVAQWQPPVKPPSDRFPAVGANAVPTYYSGKPSEHSKLNSKTLAINASEPQWRVCRDAAARAIERLRLIR